jgi:hypothetical protein
VKVQLDRPHPSERIVSITFSNDQREPQYIAKSRSFEREPDGNYFDIEPHAAYLGIAVKRLPYAGDEMLIIDPGKELTFEANLDEWYDLGPATGNRRIRYSAAQPIDGSPRMIVVESDWIPFA